MGSAAPEALSAVAPTGLPLGHSSSTTNSPSQNDPNASAIGLTVAGEQTQNAIDAEVT
jgi:hypothetical protein